MFKLAAAATAILAAGSAVAQLPALPSNIGPLSFSPQCQQAVIGVVTQGALAQCFPFADLLPLFSTNSSIIPYLDKFQTDLCYNYPTCSQATLDAAAQTIVQGCAADLQKDNISADVITGVFSAYPIIREVLCTKTSDPYTAQSYGGFLGAPPIPIVGNNIYNSTDGYFCLTSVATQLSAYFQTQLTIPYLAGLISGQNATALGLATSINPNIVCNTCFFAALEIVDLIIPAVGKTPVAAVINFFMAMVPASLGQTTIDQLFDWTCAYKPLVLSVDGHLPNGITVSIVNSSYPAPITNGGSLQPVNGGGSGPAPGNNCPCKREEKSLFGRRH